MKLTAKTIAGLTLPTGKTDHIEWDDDLPGFGLRLRAGGDLPRKTYVAQYRAHGRTRRMKVGAVEKLSPDEARKAARKILAKVEVGHDPQAEKATRRQQDGHTLVAVAADYLKAKQGVVRRNTYRELVRYLTGAHFKPLHAMPIDQITRRDVATRLTKITAESGSISAARARSAMSSLYTWALGHGLAEINPVVGTLKPQDAVPRERVLSGPELAAIWRTCGDGAFATTVKLLILTGARRSEIGGMRWSEIDMETGTWTLPAARSKNRRAHTLPLPPMALDIIAAVPRMVGRDQLFGERSARGFTKWEAAKHKLDARLGDKVSAWNLHDLRRTAATRMADIGVQPHIIEAALNHVSGHKGGVAGIYNRSSYEREVRAALALWADHVRALVEGGEKKILPLRGISA
jgi:integrase